MPWGAKYIDEIDFRFVKEDNTRVLGMIKGDYQGTGGYLPNDQVKRLREASNVKLVEAESMRIMMFQINNQRPPLTDVHVRRAISYAFDYDGFNKEILGGTVERNPAPIPNNMWGVPRDVKGYTYDLDKAKPELALARSRSTGRSRWATSRASARPSKRPRSWPTACARSGWTPSSRARCGPRWSSG